jgi:hypothetical protein
MSARLTSPNINGTTIRRVHISDVDYEAGPPAEVTVPRRAIAIVAGRQVMGAGTSTGPLFAANDWKMLADKLHVVIEQVEVDEEYQHHLDCWGDYCKIKNLPPCWRGRVEVYHYELLICGFKRLTRSAPQLGRGPRVKRRGWLRRAMRDQQRDATGWFKGLDPQTRAMLAKSYRFEDTAAKAERRYVSKATGNHQAELRTLREMGIFDF